MSRSPVYLLRKIRKILTELWHFAILAEWVKCKICDLRVVSSNPARNTFYLLFSSLLSFFQLEMVLGQI